MQIAKIVTSTQRLLHRNSQTLLTSIAISGVITTAYFSGRASYEAALVLNDLDDVETFKEKVEAVWPLYVPAGISGAATICCIFGSLKVSNRKTAAAQAALSLSDQAFAEYRDKIVEQIGESKEQRVRDSIAQDKVNQNDPANKGILITGSGSVLCREEYSGRYFECSAETLRRAQNDINAKILNHDYATLDDFYYLINIPSTQFSSDVGWESSKMMELEFSSTLTPEGKPCLVFSYNYTKQV